MRQHIAKGLVVGLHCRPCMYMCSVKFMSPSLEHVGELGVSYQLDLQVLMFISDHLPYRTEPLAQQFWTD